jgi:hypothetical protein
MLLIPLISAAFLLYVVWKSVPGPAAGPAAASSRGTYCWGIGAVIMLYARATRSPYFAAPREVFQPGAGPVPASEVPERQPTD